MDTGNSVPPSSTATATTTTSATTSSSQGLEALGEAASTAQQMSPAPEITSTPVEGDTNSLSARSVVREQVENEVSQISSYVLRIYVCLFLWYMEHGKMDDHWCVFMSVSVSCRWIGEAMNRASDNAAPSLHKYELTFEFRMDALTFTLLLVHFVCRIGAKIETLMENCEVIVCFQGENISSAGELQIKSLKSAMNRSHFHKFSQIPCRAWSWSVLRICFTSWNG